MQVLRAADRVATPWKNGGGVTREIAASPLGAGFDDFDWRVSMAEVNADGPFSVFPRIDRVLAVLEGRLRLTVDGQAHDLAPGGPPLVFPGDVAAFGDVAEGPVLDLNLMSRRGRIRSRLEILDLRNSPTPSPRGATLVVCDGAVVVDGVVELTRYDALLFDDGDAPVLLRSAAAARIYVASFEAA